MGVTRPVSQYIDDMTHIMEHKQETDDNMDRLEQILKPVMSEKKIKRQHASHSAIALGAQLDCDKMTAGLTAAKAANCRDSLRQFLLLTQVNITDMRSLAGLLSHISELCPYYMRCFLHHIYNFTKTFRGFPGRHKRWIPGSVRREVTFWRNFLQNWKGYENVYNSYHPRDTSPAIYTDASGGHKGGGGYYSTDGIFRHWRHCKQLRTKGIAYLEGWAVLQACRDMGHTWTNQRVPLFIDNQSFLGALRKRRSPVHNLNSLITQIHSLAIQHNFVLDPVWISTADNYLADALSRGNIDKFHSQLPGFTAAAA